MTISFRLSLGCLRTPNPERIIVDVTPLLEASRCWFLCFFRVAEISERKFWLWGLSSPSRSCLLDLALLDDITLVEVNQAILARSL